MKYLNLDGLELGNFLLVVEFESVNLFLDLGLNELEIFFIVCVSLWGEINFEGCGGWLKWEFKVLKFKFIISIEGKKNVVVGLDVFKLELVEVDIFGWVYVCSRIIWNKFLKW